MLHDETGKARRPAAVAICSSVAAVYDRRLAQAFAASRPVICCWNNPSFRTADETGDEDAIDPRRFRGEERSAPQAIFPQTHCCFQSGFDLSRGYCSPDDEGDHRFHHLSRQFLAESAREQKRELFVLSLIVLACAWPVISMVVTVVQLYGRHHP